MAAKNWSVVIRMGGAGNSLNFSLVASEEAILTMLRSFYQTFEGKLKEMAETPPGKRQAGLVDDALVLLRCLVLNRLEVHNGQIVNIKRE